MFDDDYDDDDDGSTRNKEMINKNWLVEMNDNIKE